MSGGGAAASPSAWPPSATLETLRGRAAILARLRAFFHSRGVLEVETPALAAATVTDLHLHSLAVAVDFAGERRSFYLQTSPEFAMKRLLAAASGPIFQLCKSFRDAESGRLHNPEFTMLEWYRPGFDHHLLMDEMDDLLAEILGRGRAERKRYGDAFAEVFGGLDPHGAGAEVLAAAAEAHGIEVVGFGPETAADDWLHLLFSHAVEPGLGRGRPTFVYDYPASQAALARVGQDAHGRRVAERFEVYAEGIELANGFHELADGAEQRRRFENDRKERRRRGLPEPPLDENLLAALAAGLPDCAGVALGVDRLVMLALGKKSLAEVIAFPSERA